MEKNDRSKPPVWGIDIGGQKFLDLLHTTVIWKSAYSFLSRRILDKCLRYCRHGWSPNAQPSRPLHLTVLHFDMRNGRESSSVAREDWSRLAWCGKHLGTVRRRKIVGMAKARETRRRVFEVPRSSLGMSGTGKGWRDSLKTFNRLAYALSSRAQYRYLEQLKYWLVSLLESSAFNTRLRRKSQGGGSSRVCYPAQDMPNAETTWVVITATPLTQDVRSKFIFQYKETFASSDHWLTLKRTLSRASNIAGYRHRPTPGLNPTQPNPTRYRVRVGWVDNPLKFLAGGFYKD